MLSEDLILRWCFAFALTQIVECPVYVFGFGANVRLAFAASTITHPIASLLLPEVWRLVYIAAIGRAPALALSQIAYLAVGGAIAETFAVVAEAWLFQHCAGWPVRRALLASLVANGSSVLIGGLSYLVTGWP